MQPREFHASRVGPTVIATAFAGFALIMLGVGIAGWFPMTLAGLVAAIAVGPAVMLVSRVPLRVTVAEEGLEVLEAGKTHRYAWTDLDRVTRRPGTNGFGVVLRQENSEQRRRRELLGSHEFFVGPGLDVAAVIAAIDQHLHR